MYIDDKVKEWMEHEKKEWQECKEIWKKIKEEIKRNKELCNYLSTYVNDSIHQELKKDFDKVVDNIESLANTFNFKSGIELSMLSGTLIHGGYLSTTDEYSYKKEIVDIKEPLDDKILYLALKIFSGEGNCRHTASFIKKVLNRFNVENSIVLVDTDSIDYDINKIRLFLNNYHKNSSPNPNHAINYIYENDFNYFLDLTSSQAEIFGAYNQFAYSLDGYNLVFPLYSYNYSSWNDEFIDYRKVPQISRGEADELIDKANNTIKICDANADLLEEFYLQNIENYRRINENYNKVYEKEKSLKLIKSDESK